MAEHCEPSIGDDASNCSSSFQKTVVLRDWWLIKCSKEFKGKRFGVAGTEESVETRAMRVFTSSPIVKALDVFTLQASDGICITLRGFLNKERVVKCGFLPEISREFIFGFPPSWERICSNCFGGVSSIIDKACSPILSPCNYSKGNLAGYPAESRDKSIVTETNTTEINNKDGSRARDKNNAKRKSLHLQSECGGKSAEDERKFELSKVQNTTNDGDHGSEGLNKGESDDVELDQCEAINNEENEWRLDESNVQNHANDESYGGEGLDKAKSSDVEKGECEAIDNEVISPPDACGRKYTGAIIVDEVTSTSATGELMTSEQSRGELKVTRASPHALFEDLDLDKSTKPGKKGSSKKSGKTLKCHGNVVEPVNHSGTKVESTKKKTKLDTSKVQKPTTNDGDHGSEGLNGRHVGTDSVDKHKTKKATKKSLSSEQRKGRVKVTKTSLHSLSEDLNKSSKSGKKSKSKKSERNVVEPMKNSGSEVKEDEDNLSWGKTKRKIDFDEEVTPDKEVKKQKTNSASTDSLGQKRSRSGRILVSSLEFWRNQLPVYDKDRNLIQVKEGAHETSSTLSKGKGSVSRKPRR